MAGHVHFRITHNCSFVCLHFHLFFLCLAEQRAYSLSEPPKDQRYLNSFIFPRDRLIHGQSVCVSFFYVCAVSHDRFRHDQPVWFVSVEVASPSSQSPDVQASALSHMPPTCTGPRESRGRTDNFGKATDVLWACSSGT